MESVVLKLKSRPSCEEVKKILEDYQSEAQRLKLPSAPLTA